MVSSLDDTLDTALIALTVIEDNEDRPSPSQINELDDCIESRFNWAFRFGIGSSSSLNDYRYGYIIPILTINPETMKKIEQNIQEKTSLDNPTVLARPIQIPDEEEFESMHQIGDPHNQLSSLQDFVDEINDAT